MKILLLMVCLSFSGCALVEKGLVNLLTPNPENKRIETEAQKDRDAYSTLKDPNIDKGKAEIVKEIRLESGKQSHPSFFSSVVSGLYTEEGRRLAGITMLALVSIGMAAWKGIVAYSKGQTILGLGRFIEKEVKPVVGKEVVRNGVGKELGPLDFKFRKILKKKGIS